MLGYEPMVFFQCECVGPCFHASVRRVEWPRGGRMARCNSSRLSFPPPWGPWRGETGARDDILRWTTCIFRPQSSHFRSAIKKQTKSLVAVGGQLERTNTETHGVRQNGPLLSDSRLFLGPAGLSCLYVTGLKCN